MHGDLKKFNLDFHLKKSGIIKQLHYINPIVQKKIPLKYVNYRLTLQY